MIVKIKRLGKDARLPVYASIGAAGCDVHSTEKLLVPAGKTVLVPTGIFLEVPNGYECQIRPRSGLALMDGVIVLNSPGTIDSDYRGEVKVMLHNTSTTNRMFFIGDRIAQLVFAPVVRAEFVLVDELNETQRGSGGFGSTGEK